jgi:hypothetical protein
MNDVPGMVKRILESGEAKVKVQIFVDGMLDDLAPRADVRDSIAKGRWTHIVLQGARLSSSHKYEYSKQPGIDLARLAAKSGAQPLLFAEHPRRGWDEAAWIYEQYGQIKKAVNGASVAQRSKPTPGTEHTRLGCEIVPCPFAFAQVLKADPKLDLWMPDGNHANLAGSYLNALTIAYWIAGPEAKLSFVSKGVDATTARALDRAAREAVRQHR